MRRQKIQTKPSRKDNRDLWNIGGWLDGKESYLRIELSKNQLGLGSITWIHGQSLYRLAKAIVRHWEADKKEK